MSVIGKITWNNGRKSVPITDEDLRWAGRAAARETDNSAAGRAAVLWSWAQRLVWYVDRGLTSTPCREQPNRPITLAWVIRCHSQPVNPYWRDRGDAGQVRARQYLQSSAATWEALERGAVLQPKPNLKRDVYAWGRGEIPNPIPRLADFSAPGQPDVPAGAPVIHGNAFFAEPGRNGTVGWPDGYVTIQPARGLQALGLNPVTLTLGATLTALAIALAVFAFRPRAVANKVPRRRYRQRRQQWALAA